MKLKIRKLILSLLVVAFAVIGFSLPADAAVQKDNISFTTKKIYVNRKHVKKLVVRTSVNHTKSTYSQKFYGVKKNGKQVWKKATGVYKITKFTKLNRRPIIRGSLLYYVNPNGRIVALNLNNGRIYWRTKMNTIGAIAHYDFDQYGNFYVCGYEGPDLMKISRSGAVAWKVDKVDPSYSYPCKIEAGIKAVHVYFNNDRHGIDPQFTRRIHVKFNSRTGKQILPVQKPVQKDDISVTTKTIFVNRNHVKKLVVRTFVNKTKNTYTRKFIGVRKNGEIVWKKSIGAYQITQFTDTNKKPIVRGSLLYYVSPDGRLTAVNLNNGHLYWRTAANTMGDIAHYDFDQYGNLYVCGYEGPDLMKINRSGYIVWKTDKVDPSYSYPCRIKAGNKAVYVYFNNDRNEIDPQFTRKIQVKFDIRTGRQISTSVVK